MKFILDDQIVDSVELDKSGAIRVFIKKDLVLTNIPSY